MNPLVQARAALEIYVPDGLVTPAAKVSVASRSGGMVLVRRTTSRNPRQPACGACRSVVRGDDHAKPVSPLR